jgi:hypothetical protein
LELVLQRAVPVSQELYQVCEQQVVIEQEPQLVLALQNLLAQPLVPLVLEQQVMQALCQASKYLAELQA